MIFLEGAVTSNEPHRDAGGLPALDVLLQDLRYTFRLMRRDRAFTLIAVLILGLGIGANVAVFSVVNTILLRPLPFRDAKELVWIQGSPKTCGLSCVTYSVDAFESYQRGQRSLESVTAYMPFYGAADYKLSGYGDPKPVSGVWIACNFFQTLGIRPALGRLFAPEECRKNASHAVLLSYLYWKQQFDASPSIVGQPITLNKESVTVVGVLPPTFDFGSVFAPGTKMDILVPAPMDDMRYWGNTLLLIGRMKPETTVVQVQAEATMLFPTFYVSLAHPEYGKGYQGEVQSLKDHVSGKLRRSLIVLWSAVALILLIVCVNLSSLSLARAAARTKEFAMRSALGAARGRLIRQLLTESMVLATGGAFLGLGFAFLMTYYLAHQGSIALPLLSTLRVDGSALAWTLLVAVASALLFGVAPALRMSGKHVQESLKDSGHGTTAGHKHDRMRSALVISEVALACVLLIGAGLLLRSFLRVLDVDLGFRPDRAAAISVEYDDGGGKDAPVRRGTILQEMLRHIKAIPGIHEAGVSDMLPLDRNRSWSFGAKGVTYRGNESPDAFVYVVTPGYLDAMGMRLRAGRDVSWSDGPTTQPVAILNEAAAKKLWPGQDPLGRMAVIGGGDATVIGVVSDVRETSVEDSSGLDAYLPVTQAGPVGAELVIRTSLPPDVLASSVIKTLRELNPGQPSSEFRPLRQIVDHAVSPRRFFVVLVSAFAALGLILASLGIYGVISYSVARQTQEIGIRMALGATAGIVQRAVIGNTLRLAAAGVLLGTVAALVVSKLIASLLFDTAPTDPATFAGMILLLCAVALIAGYIPARRASRIDPMIALRSN
ncbi:MAG TPA: ABC transporter permease [Terriglobia bacterium]|nr:ABC transporter permease [Terriglobia bacterium]